MNRCSDHLEQDSFSAAEAAEYLEASLATLRRYVQSGKLKPSQVIGRTQLFATSELRQFKRHKELKCQSEAVG